MNICTAPVYKLEELNNLFIEMTSKNCNHRCESCYINFPYKKDVKDFIKIDTIKEALNHTKDEKLHCIYLTGAEPMTHPDFNSVLRLCLKRCNVCICTNASFLNEKKIRFLKKVEDEGLKNVTNVNNNTEFVETSKVENQIFFRLSLTHYDEKLNDKAKYHGHFRQNISALKILGRYNFTSVLNVQNYYDLEHNEIVENFKKIFAENNIENTELQISVSYPQKEQEVFTHSPKTDCMNGRMLTQNGIYACPFLSHDYRGRAGSSFKDYSKSINAETDFCSVCAANKNWVFTIG